MQLRRVLRAVALALLAFPALAGAQGTATITGRVTDAASGSPLAGNHESFACHFSRLRNASMSLFNWPLCVSVMP